MWPRPRPLREGGVGVVAGLEQAAALGAGVAYLRCSECGHDHAPFAEIRYTCAECGDLLEARYDTYPTFADFEGKGVWRYDAALPFEESEAQGGGDAAGSVTLPEGDTPTTLHKHDTPEEMVECMRHYGYVRDA